MIRAYRLEHDHPGGGPVGTEPRTYPPETHAERGSGLALTALVAGAVGIACAPIFISLSEVGPTATAFLRLALALPIVWLWTEVGRRREAKPPRRLSGAGPFSG